MIVKTKKFSLDKKVYRNLSFSRHMRQSWYWLLIPAAVLVLGLILHFTGVYKNWWVSVVALLGAAGYMLFWYAQFYAATEMEQNQQMFDKFAYEIDSRQIMVKINAKEGGIVKWDSFTHAEKLPDAFLLVMNKAQFLHFPFHVFNSEHDLKLFENILRRKSLLS